MPPPSLQLLSRAARPFSTAAAAAATPSSRQLRSLHSPSRAFISYSTHHHHDTSTPSRARKQQIRPRVQHLTSPRRTLSSSPTLQHGHLDKPRPGEELHVTFVDKDGERHAFEVCSGDNLLDIAQANDLEMEGACGGSCACSTCHVIIEDPGLYDQMPEPDDDENDMLDLAFGLTETSRLGCQVKMSRELDGLVVKLPAMTRNLQKSDFGDEKAKKSYGTQG